MYWNYLGAKKSIKIICNSWGVFTFYLVEVTTNFVGVYNIFGLIISTSNADIVQNDG